MKTLLVMAPGRLGDFVLAVPAIRQLVLGMPDWKVTLAVGPEAGDLAVKLPWPYYVAVGARPTGKKLFFGDRLDAHYDAGVLLRYDADYYGAAELLVDRCDWVATWAHDVTKAKLERNGPQWDKNFNVLLQSDGAVLHEVLRNLELAGAVAGIDVRIDEPLTLPFLYEYGVVPELPLVVAPFTGEAHKDMLTDWWPLLRGHEPLLIGTGGQRALLESMAEEVGGGVYTGPLLSACGLVANAQKVVTMDSGMSHVAAAYGRPHMAIFTGWDGTDGTSYDPKRFGPWAPTSRWTRQQDQLADFLEA